MLRICELFQNWVPSPKDFHALSEENQTKLLAYQLIREAEHWETVELQMGVSSARKTAGAMRRANG